MTPEAPLMPTIRRGRTGISPASPSVKSPDLLYLRFTGQLPLADYRGRRYHQPLSSSRRRKWMSPQDRIEALKAKHAELERAIDEENSRPLPNRDAVSDLKRQKLRIKDEIFELERH